MDGEDLLEDLEKFDLNDHKRKLAIQPKLTRVLFRAISTSVARLYHAMEDLVTLRRSSTSSLPHSGMESGKYEMSDAFPPYHIRMVELEHRPSERREFEIHHLILARRYYDSFEAKKIRGTGEEGRIPSGPTGPTAKVTKTFPGRELRALAINTTSTKLSRFQFLLDILRLDSHSQSHEPATIRRFICGSLCGDGVAAIRPADPQATWHARMVLLRLLDIRIPLVYPSAFQHLVDQFYNGPDEDIHPENSTVDKSSP